MELCVGKELENKLLEAFASYLFVKQFHRWPTASELEKVKELVKNGWVADNPLPIQNDTR